LLAIRVTWVNFKVKRRSKLQHHIRFRNCLR